MSSVERLSAYLIMVFPWAIIGVKLVNPIIFLLLILIGIFMIVRYKSLLFSIPEVRLFGYLTVGYFFSMFLSVLLSHEPTNNWIHLSRIGHFLVAPILIVVLYRTRVPLGIMIQSVKIGISLAGLVSIVEFFLSSSNGRFSGMYNANTFGDIATVLTLFSILLADKESQKEYLFSLLSVSLGAAAIVLSGSRASMIVFIALLAIYLVIKKLTVQENYRKVLLVATVGLVAFFAIFLSSPSSQHRISLIETQVSSWNDGKDYTSSVGVRLEMYQSGWEAFKQAPLIGYGYYNATKAASRYARTEKAKKQIYRYWHLHNEYLSAMVSAGVIGLLALLALYMLPMRIFISKLKDTQRGNYALMGIVLIAGYGLLGMVHGELGYEYETMFFVFFLGYSLIGVSTPPKQSISRDT